MQNTLAIKKNNLKEAKNPTEEMYNAVSHAFNYFNKVLFNDTLPPCLITLRSSNRIKGYHHTKRFISRSGHLADELGLNPGFFSVQPVEIALSTLVHEMVHHWQENYGKPSKSNSHNKEWVRKMIELGLHPSDTALPGGEQTGNRMSHYIIKGGMFDAACRSFVAEGYQLPWMDRHIPISTSQAQVYANQLIEQGVVESLSEIPSNIIADVMSPHDTFVEPIKNFSVKKIKYQCEQCDIRVWAETDANIICGDCGVQLAIKAK